VKAARAAPLITAAAVALGVAALGGLVTDTGEWYQSLAKPTWNPPDWLFGPAWTLIYGLTALSAAIAWSRTGDANTRAWLIALFAINGALNILWSALFFRFRRPDLALLEVSVLWLSILALIIYTSRVARSAAWLLVPYLAWVTFAAILNRAVVRLNG
jgi:tryptophan-rich sensory protein